MNIEGLSYALHALGDPDSLAADWTGLEERSDCPFFLTWDWIGTWLAMTPGLSPLLLTVRDGPSLVALALLQSARQRRRFRHTRALLLHRTGDPITDIITIEYNGLLVDRLYRDRVMQSLFAFLKRTRLCGAPFGDWDEIHVAMATQEIAQKARAEGLVTLELAHKPSWFVDLDAVRRGGGVYLESLSSNTRYQIRRAFRLYQEHGPVTANAARSAEEAMGFFAEFKQLHQATWVDRGQPGGFSNSYFENFHRTLLRRCIARGTVELVRVAAGDHLIGQVYNFIHRGRVYAYQTGFAYEADARLKPGLVSHCLCIERHLQNGAHAYDFMAGDNRYKSNLGIRGPDLMHHVLQRRTLPAMGEILLRKLKTALSPRR